MLNVWVSSGEPGRLHSLQVLIMVEVFFRCITRALQKRAELAFPELQIVFPSQAEIWEFIRCFLAASRDSFLFLSPFPVPVPPHPPEKFFQ